MIKIEDSFSGKRVCFGTTQPSGRVTLNSIIANPYDDKYIEIPATGDIQLQDIPEFIKAIELAAMIASGELEVD
jgi:hypothetical protein